MGGPFDFLSGLEHGAEQVGGYLKNLVTSTPSRPAPSPHAPLPQPQNSPTQAPRQAPTPPNRYSGGSNYQAPKDMGGRQQVAAQFAKDTGLQQLGSNMLGTDTTNKNTIAGQIADPNSPVSQAQKGWSASGTAQAHMGPHASPQTAGQMQPTGNPMASAGQYAANVLNAGVIDPIRLAADPSMWFASDNNKQDSHSWGGGNTPWSNDSGHNYLRDMFNPIVKQITGEDVPPTTMSYQNQTQTLNAEATKLEQAQQSLTPQSSAEDIAAYNSKLTEFNAKMDKYKADYAKSQDWWTNSNVAKTLSVVGQIATFPAGFAAGMATFVPNLVADPIGTGESMISQVTMAAHFASTLMDPEARGHLTSQEWAANLSNIAMLGGMLFGPKGAGKVTEGLGATHDTILGTHPDPAALQKIKTDLNEHDTALHNAEPAPHAETPVVDPNGSKADLQVHAAMQTENLNVLREKLQASPDAGHRALYQKQINDIQDERTAIDNAPKPYKAWHNVLGDQIRSLTKGDDPTGGKTGEAYIQELYRQLDTTDPAFVAQYFNLSKEDVSKIQVWLEQYNKEKGIQPESEYAEMSPYKNSPQALSQDATLRPGETTNDTINRSFGMMDKNAEVATDIGNEKSGTGPQGSVARPEYTQPVLPNTGFPDSQVDTMLKGMQDFTRPVAQAEAARKNPEEYASPNAAAPDEAPREMTPEEHKAAFEEYTASGKHDQVRSAVKQDTQALFARQRRLAIEEGQKLPGNPDYVPPSVKAPTAGPVTKFEELAPKTIEAMARNAGFDVVPVEKMTGNAWILRNGKAINIGKGVGDPYANHDLFIREMRMPGDSRGPDANGEHNVTKMDLMHKGWIRVSDFSPMHLNIGVDRFDHENLPIIEDAIRMDMAKKNTRFEPYMIDEWDTGMHYTIDPQEFMANDGDLASLVSQIRRIQLAKNGYPRTQIPEGPTSAAVFKEAVEQAGWKLVPAKKVEYGWLFPGGKGTDIGMSADGQRTSIRGVHADLWEGFGAMLGRNVPPMEYRDLISNAVQLRRGYGPDVNDHFFWAEKWTPATLKIVEDYLQERTTRPSFVGLESRAGTMRKVIGSSKRGSSYDTSFTYQEFKDNDFRLEGLMNRKDFGPRSQAPEGPAAKLPRNNDPTRGMGSYAWDNYTRLQKLLNRLNYYEDPKDYEMARKIMADLGEGMDHPAFQATIKQIQEKLNEKGYPALTETGPESAAGQGSQELNRTPPGAPEGSTLTSVIPGPQGKGQVAIWTPAAKPTGTVSPRERGLTELKQTLWNEVLQLTDIKNEAQDIRILEALPVNELRRQDEVTQVFKARIDDLNPLGVVTIKHLIFDPELETEAMYEPTTGVIRYNVTKNIPIKWLQGVAGMIQKNMLELKGMIPDEGYQALHDWYTTVKNLTQAQADFGTLAEEILHKHDVDHFSGNGYLEALSRLPAEWWDHARRSGIGDVFEEGIKFRKINEKEELTLKDINGAPVRSWKTAFDMARTGDSPYGLLNYDSWVATLHTFMEFRVTQLRNYHGIPGSGFTYRVPEVMTREIENPALIREGAAIAGNDFERYVQAETANGLAERIAHEEETPSDVPTRSPRNATDGSAPALSDTPTAGIPGRDTGSQGSINPQTRAPKEQPQDFPQVGDRLQIDMTQYPVDPEKFVDMSKYKPQWSNFWDNPLRDDEDIRRAAQLVSTRGAGLSDKIPTNFRVVTRTGQVRNFKGEMPERPTQMGTPDLSKFEVKENPPTFHGVPAPNVEPLDLNSRAVKASASAGQAGFSKKTLRLSQADPVNVPVPKAIGEGYTEAATDSQGKPIAQSLKYKPIIALRETDYPGSWVDFLHAMSADEGSIEYQTARPYWDKLALKYKQAWMEAMREPGVQDTVINAAPSPDAVSPEEMASPAFQARQLKIQGYRSDIENSGPILNKLSKTVNTAEGLKKFAQAKALVAAKSKYVSLDPSIPEMEATQLSGKEFTKVMDEITKQPPDPLTGKPRDPQVEAMMRPKSLLSQLTPQQRDTIGAKVVRRYTDGKLAEGYYKSIDAFIDGYAVREPAAVKLYNKMSGMSKDAVKKLVEQYPQSFMLSPKDRLDQTSIPLSAQAAPDHINPVDPAQFYAIAQGAVQAAGRHGSTDYNEKGLIRAWANPPLSSLGRLQARNMAKAYAGRRGMRIATHDLERAQETANSIATRAPGAKVTVDPRLRPWNPGTELTGSSVTTATPIMKDWMQNHPDYVPPGGESFNQFKARYLPAFKEHLLDGKNLIVASTRNLRLAEAWMANGMPDDLSVDLASMLDPREIGPGGLMTIGNTPDGNYTINHKVSQAPSDAESLAAPRVPKGIGGDLRPGQVSVDMGARRAGTQPRPDLTRPTRSEPEGVSPQGRYSFKIGEQADKKTANIKGELTSAMPQDVMDRIDSIVADHTIDPTNPLKIAAIRAQMERKGVADARAMQVPAQEVTERVQNLTTHVDKVAELVAQQAQADLKAAPLTAPPQKNQLVFQTSILKASEHRDRVLKGMDWSASTTRAAREILIEKSTNPLGDMIGILKDGADGLLPKDHIYHSLSPAFKEVFVDPHAVEIVKQDKLSEPAKSGLMPLPTDTQLGADVPVKPIATGPKAAAARRARPTTKTSTPVVPAVAEVLRARTPNPDPPVEQSVAEIQKEIKFHIGEAAKMSTRELRQETDQIHELINTPSPDLFSDGEEGIGEGIDVEDGPKDSSEAIAQVADVTSGKGRKGGGGRGKKPPEEPLKGWDDARDFASSYGGDHKQAANLFDRALKSQVKSLNPSSNTSHPREMATAHIKARNRDQYTGDQLHTLLLKMMPPDDVAHNRAMQKAIGGPEPKRQAALKLLSDKDQALANMINAYHTSMGRIGVNPDTHVFDYAADNYLRRQVLFDETGKAPKADVHGNTMFSKKLSIAYSRRTRDVQIGKDENGKPIIRTQNYYEDLDDLRSKGFKVEESVANLVKGHWDQFSNMNTTHQFIRDLSTLHAFKESDIKPGVFNVGGQGLKRGAAQWTGRVLVPNMEKGKKTLVSHEFEDQLDRVKRGAFKVALRDYQVYKPMVEILERMTTSKHGDGLGEKAANTLAYANGVYKVLKFGYNPLHALNLMSNVYAFGTHGLTDPATYFPHLLAHRIFGRTDELLSEKGSYTWPDGTVMSGTDVVAKIMELGGVLPKEIVDVANLGGLSGTLSRYAPGFKQWHNVMWHDIAWKGHIGLILHQMDVGGKAFEKATGRKMNAAEVTNASKLAVEMSKYAMGFLDKSEMTHDWQVYGNSVLFANSWSLSQLRLLGKMLPGKVPGAQFLANLGGGEKYNSKVTEDMMTKGNMTQEGLDVINGMTGKMARRMMLGGAAKLMAMSTAIAYIGSYFGNQGQAQGPWDNAQRDATHIFDIYLGTDPVTGKDMWQHNPIFGMQQEMLLYMLQGVKDSKNGTDIYGAMAGMAARYKGKENPILSTVADLAVGRDLTLYLKGYGDNSIIDKDHQIIAIRRGLDAAGLSPFPESVRNNIIYAIRQAFPLTPGFPDTLNTKNGMAPEQTNATLGNTLNALGPGKFLGIGDLINAYQTGDFSNLAKIDLGNLAQYALGTSQRTSSTPATIATGNQIDAAITTRDQRNSALNDLSNAAQANDWKTVAMISQQLDLSTSEVTQALLHPVAGGGQGVLYKDLPSKSNYNPPTQETLLGQELSVDDTAKLTSIRNANVMRTIRQVTSMSDFKTGDSTTRTSAIVSYISLVTAMTNDQFAQSVGLLGGTAITDADIQGALNTAIEFRGVASDALAQTDLYTQADPIERQRMETTYGTYATTLAREGYNGSLKGVPLENIRGILTNTIQVTEATRSYLSNSMFYQLSSPNEQARMLKEYSSLAQTVARREALQQGQGTYNFQIPPDKMIPTIQFIINVEETGKSQLHGTDYYNSQDPTTQKALDTKYETLARGLAFSTSNADPRILITNSLNAEQSYYDLQTQFGGTGYIKTMAAELADAERNIRTTAEYSPRQIAAIERGVRLQFLRANPAYAAWLTAKTNWGKYSTNGQIYNAMNNSEYAAVDDMQSAGVISNNSLLISGTSADNTPMDPGSNLGLPSIDYNTFNAQNP